MTDIVCMNAAADYTYKWKFRATMNNSDSKNRTIDIQNTYSFS